MDNCASPPDPPRAGIALAPAPIPATLPRKRPRANADYRWTVPKVHAFLAALAQSGRVAEAARAVGMSRQAAYALRARLDGPRFRAAFEGARKTGIRARAAASRYRSKWEGPGLAALDYLQAAPPRVDGAVHADTGDRQADTGHTQADGSRPQADTLLGQADTSPRKPTIFSLGPCNTRSMSLPKSNRSGGDA